MNDEKAIGTTVVETPVKEIKKQVTNLAGVSSVMMGIEQQATKLGAGGLLSGIEG